MARKKAVLSAPECRLWCGKCEELLQQVPRDSVPLIIADAPYNMGKKYADYDDTRDIDEYLRWSYTWLYWAWAVLHKHGTLVVFYPDELVADMDTHLRRLRELHRQSWIVWSFGFGVACQKNFSRSHCHILRYTKTKTRFTFNDMAVRVPSDRAVIYNDPRASPKGKLPNDTWLLHKDQIDAAIGKGDKDTWYESRIAGTFRERQAVSPNQIPVPIMERLVLSLSRPGDLVVDPFCGAGSAGEAALKHGRNYLGMDVSKACIAATRKRLDGVLGKPLLRVV